MRSWEYAFFFILMLAMLPRIFIDGYAIISYRKEMARRITKSFIISPPTAEALMGVSRWSERLHCFIMVFALGSFVYWSLSPSWLGAAVVTLELMTLAWVGAPLRYFTGLMLERFFDVDLSSLEEVLK